MMTPEPIIAVSRIAIAFWLCTLLMPFTVPAQTSITDLPDKAINSIEKKYTALNNRINKQLQKTLSKAQRQETRLQKKLAQKDSTAAAQLFTGTQEQYNKLQHQLNSPLRDGSDRVSNYIPRLDSLQTATKFLAQSGVLNNSKLNEVKQLSGELQQLEGSLHSAEQIEAYLKQRKELLTAQLEKFGMAKDITNLKKQAYYYRQQIDEYKSILNDQQKLEAKALEVLRELPAFQSFMQKNSYLAQLFPSTGSSATGGDPMAALSGLQTRASVNALLQERFGAALNAPSGDGGGIASNPLEQGMQAAQEQLNALKDKVNKLGGGSSDVNMPEGFVPNNQRTKTFWQRLEPGIILQSSGSSKWLPAMTDIGLSIGYKLGDKKTIGVKLCYKAGWGAPLKDIHFSSEGVNLGAFVDIKLKASWWISGAAEYNYMQGFKSLQQLHDNVNVWQQSALLGISRKVKVGKRTSNAQVLYDFLWKQQVPVSGSAWKFRVGVGL